MAHNSAVQLAVNSPFHYAWVGPLLVMKAHFIIINMIHGKKAVEEFGGCVPTSFCEDMLLHKFCADRLDSFNVVQIENDTPLFIRCSDGTNASEVEWTEDVHNDHPYHWAHGVASEIRREISTPISPERIQKAGNEFLQTGTINWTLAVQSVPAFRSRIENVLTPKPPSPF